MNAIVMNVINDELDVLRRSHHRVTLAGDKKGMAKYQLQFDTVISLRKSIVFYQRVNEALHNETNNKTNHNRFGQEGKKHANRQISTQRQS